MELLNLLSVLPKHVVEPALLVAPSRLNTVS